MQLDEELIRNSKNFGASIFQRKIELKQELLNLIKEGNDIPESFKNLLFPPKEEPKEIELKYGIKEREEDILVDMMGMPFQPVKQFGNVKEGEFEVLVKC